MNSAVLLLLKFIVRDLARNKVRTLLTLAGIALGVAVMLAIHLANQAALGQFRESIDLVAGRTNLSIHPLAGGEMDEALVDQLGWLNELNVKYTPLIDQFAVVADGTGTELVQVLGVDIFADHAFRSFSRRSPDLNQSLRLSPLQLLQSDQATIGTRLAKRFNRHVGDKLTVQANDHLVELKVAAVLQDSGAGKAFGGNLILMDIGPAQKLFSLSGTISRIDMIVPANAPEDLITRLKSLVGEGFSVERPERRGAQIEKMLASFQYNLGALSLIALLVGMFVIYNTMSISVIRRRLELGTLRALGVTRNTIFLLFAFESIVLGLIGSSAGAMLGLGFAKFALAAVSRTVRSLYADQPAGEVHVQPEMILLAIVAGVVMTFVAAMAPSVEAVNVSPAEATRRASFERKVKHMSPKLALLGALLAAGAGWCAVQPAINGFPVWGFVAAASAVFSVALFTPAVLDLGLPAFKAMMSRLAGTEGSLAISGLYGALGRTSVAVASLMVGIAMMVSLAVMIGSFRHTVIAWVQQTLRADMWVEPAGRRVSSRIGHISEELVEKLRKVPGIEALESFSEFPFEYEGTLTNLGAGEIDIVANYGNLPFVDGEPSKSVLQRLRGRNAVTVSESFALKHNKHKGDTIVLPAPGGPLAVRIEGVYYDYSTDTGFVIMDRAMFKKYFRDEGPSTLAIYLQKDQDTERVRQELVRAAGTAQISIRSNRELKVEVMRVFDNTFAITYALHAISISVAILGVMNTLFALTMESKRDMGILKYLGASDRQIQKLILVQAGVLGASGSVGGLLTGFVLSWLLIHVINKQSFGWTIQFAIPYEFLLQSFALIMFCSLASGVIPARLAARTVAPEALRSE